jgi:hypothetical protein
MKHAGEAAMRQRIDRVLIVLAFGMLAACGGGGGDDNEPVAPAPTEARFSGSFNATSLEPKTIEGQPAVSVEFFGSLTYTGTEDLVIAIEEVTDIVADGDFTVSEIGTLSARLVLDAARPAGIYTSVVNIRACLDQACTREVAGSPVQIPLRYEVLPQVKIDAPQPFRRVGAASAATQRLAVAAPSEAGPLEIRAPDFNVRAYDLRLVDGALEVRPRQVQAGSYPLQVEVVSQFDSRFRQSIALDYVVEPPLGGEVPLSVEPANLDLALLQGELTTRRVRVRPPTWTDAPVSVRFEPSAALPSLRQVGPEEWELTIDTRGIPRSPEGGGAYRATLIATAIDQDGSYEARWSASVLIDPPLLPSDTSPTFRINRSSTPADLVQRITIDSPDGMPWRWTARSDSPWLALSPANGTAGVDGLTLTVDPTVLSSPLTQNSASIELLSDRPGTTPVTIPAFVVNQIPSLETATPGVLTGSSASVFLAGRLHAETGATTPGVVSVEGAVLRSLARVSDSRFVGDVSMLRLDLDGIEPGRPVVVRSNATLLTDVLTLSSVGTSSLPAGHAELPDGRYRPPSWLPGAQALVFAGGDKVWWWPASGVAWSVPRSQSLPGVLDIDPAPDETELRALVLPEQIVALAPDTLLPLRSATVSEDPRTQRYRLDEMAPTTLSSLRHAPDGRSFVSVSLDQIAGQGIGVGVGWVAGCPLGYPGGLDIVNRPCIGDPGVFVENIGPAGTGAGITRSPGRKLLVMSHPSGRVQFYRDLGLQRQTSDAVPAGRVVVGVDDNGGWTVQDDGRLRLTGVPDQSVLLGNLLEPGYRAQGFAVSGAGDYALIYGYRVAQEAGGERARDAALWQVDLRGGLAALQVNPVPPVRLPLPDAVGCLRASIPCSHQAHLLVAPGDRGAFLLGPQGVAAVALPSLAPRAAAAGGLKPLRRKLQPAR